MVKSHPVTPAFMTRLKTVNRVKKDIFCRNQRVLANVLLL